ncbi:hypothetical protein PHYBLDRAFT_180192 [Phycomyces blakesleeanus NRRL 1555(-)]|uniref:SAM domain-containing protein n=1 Tax=Phycomyces blakesleeanus (strain ATCC 8743b / DSM 1359 / FGSC 10004 / NBRC 33097 / NRRL 1555) TaxID=763407 RepID=A0A167NVD0_PHYB8|nr:hypothetical protein PHYBLDRAFT_180192 [Phycomyces blakesleeanus NRRL 1555(-)]OAD76688.1 hypothetical protein PHYBLDRAFT_180192 [Phycomyces blakesleeanus NRRL 1555(-)]|eukprot:XP_018294728.1 hypothetical protein PHYBLDRAFT_180192 [Phycomyces blakesleeanus NRRL 1555(-)]
MKKPAQGKWLDMAKWPLYLTSRSVCIPGDSLEKHPKDVLVNRLDVDSHYVSAFQTLFGQTDTSLDAQAHSCRRVVASMENVLLWDEIKVNKWMASIGYSVYEKSFREQGITGDVLVNLDHESLKDLSVHSLGQRIDMLKNIYHLKSHYRIPVNEWDYVPPSVLYEKDWLGQNGLADYRKIEAAFQERDAHIKRLAEDLYRLNSDMYRLKDDMTHVLRMGKEKKAGSMYEAEKSPSTPPVQKGHAYLISSSNNTGTNNSSSSLTAANSSQPKPLHMLTPPTSHYQVHSGDYFQTTPYCSDGTKATDDAKLTPSVTINDGGAIKVYGEKISNNSSKVEMESSKNVRLLLDDPCSKVITSALKKYNVADDWQQYALWIQYGPHDNLQERALGYDERPLRISQKFKEAKQNPVFVLKHVKDNKVFFPTAEMTNNANNNKSENLSSSYPSRQPHHIASSFVSPRPAPKPAQTPYLRENTHPLDDATTASKEHNERLGSSLNPQQGSYANYGWKSNEKRTGDNPKTAITTGRVGYEMVVPVMSSSISTPTPSSIPGSIGSSMTLTPSISKRGGTINAKSTDSLLSELGLDSGVASAIYSIMMEDDKNM